MLTAPLTLPDDPIWVFDLDNTLYPPSCDLFKLVDARMMEYLSDYLKVDPAEARRIQKHYYREHGTTLRGMMDEHGMAPGPYLEYVHEIDVSGIDANQELDAALTALPGRKLIFTNGSVRHAHNVAGKLGIVHHFEAVFDIVAANYVPKPDPETYASFLALHDVDPARAVMFEDLPRNLVPAAALGMTTVWVRGNDELADIAAEGPHIHHVTDDLVDFLRQAITPKA